MNTEREYEIVLRPEPEGGFSVSRSQSSTAAASLSTRRDPGGQRKDIIDVMGNSSAFRL